MAAMLDVVAAPLTDLLQRAWARAPGLVGAFFCLLAGLLVARWVRSAVEAFLNKGNLDQHAGSIGVNEVLARLGLGKSPTYAVGFVAYWALLMVFFVAAAHSVALPAVDDMLERFVAFLPSAAAAILVLFGGMLFARLAGQVVGNAAAANNVRGEAFLSRAASLIVLSFAFIQALEQLGIRLELVRDAALILVASAGLAVALAFGLGGKSVAEEILREALNRKKV